MTENYRDQRMIELMSNMPQNRATDFNAVVPVVEFNFSEHADPDKARKQNIKRAIKALKPTRTWYTLPGTGLIPFIGRARFKYSNKQRPYVCVIDGCDCRHLDYGDLWEVYFVDPTSKQIAPFRPWSGVLPSRGLDLFGTYCPQHMQLYHLLMDWIEQEESNDTGFFKRMKKRGVAFVPVVKRKNTDNQHPLISKWNPVFEEALRDPGISVLHYKNPETGENDITTIVFDNRILKTTPIRGKSLDSEYVIEPTGQEESQ